MVAHQQIGLLNRCKGTFTNVSLFRNSKRVEVSLFILIVAEMVKKKYNTNVSAYLQTNRN